MRYRTALIAAAIAMATGVASASATTMESVPWQSNTSTGSQDDPAASGGEANATCGEGGEAKTGNTQIGNGHAVAVSVGGDSSAEGGETTADSGDAYGGDGGNADADGGNAGAANEALTGQVNESSAQPSHSSSDDCGCHKSSY